MLKLRALFCLLLLPVLAHAECRPSGKTGTPAAFAMLAISQNDVACLEALLAEGVDPDDDSLGRTLMTYAIQFSVFKESPKMVEVLLAAGADPNLVSKYNHPLHSAISNGLPLHVIDSLLQHGANMYARRPRSELGIWNSAAFRSDKVELLDLLMKYGYDVNHQQSKGNTILHNAIVLEDLALATRLMTYCANPKILADNGRSPLDSARIKARRNPEFLSLLNEVHCAN